MHPIYIIVYEQLYSGSSLDMYGLPRVILAVISCDVSDIDDVYKAHIAPLQAQGRRVQQFYLSREPNSFLRETLSSEGETPQ